MSLNLTSTESILNSLSEAIESELLSQLNDFISRGLIVVHKGPTTLVKDFNSDTVKIATSCKLVLKDKEYIEQLEKENKELKEIITKIKEVV